ncbi:uracil-DNA glycosylase [Mycoplasmopsis maculosa]|uniref:Uracil-DNA glycosylase n=1 Tax=Mycoplasmopsis maculosa TaxID=114885 RepID=A0A449B4D4_9BACT|nr:uracil-DNA glycosylase [Mycoplasmopsis maculosa]VEU75457.1 uracil-DNA glycosylase [Mycoplasmopsis maculosa]
MKNKFALFVEKESKKDYFIELFKKINFERKTKKVFPKEEDIFRCLNYFEPEETKLIIIGQDPYYLENQADGLAFSSNDLKTPKSLINIFKEIKKDYPEAIFETNSLEYWAKQGVLLLNSCLTVNKDEPNSHKDFGWNFFIDNLLNFICEINKNVVFGLWGNYAFKIAKNAILNNNINEKQIIFTSHPSPLSYWKRSKNSFRDSNFFKKVNNLLKTKIDFSSRKE